MQVKGRWLFVLAAGIPCVVFFIILCVGVHEWYLVATHQVVVIPRPQKGDVSVPNMPASDLYPWIFVSGALTAAFAYALMRNSTRILKAGWLLVLAIVAQAWIRHHL